MRYLKMISSRLVEMAVLVTGLLAATGVAAQGGGPSLEPGGSRISLVGKVGFGGEAAGDVREYENGRREDIDRFDDRDMETTHGLAGEYAYAVHENFLIGGRLSFNWINTDEFDERGIDRSMLVNLDVVPRGRLSIAGAPMDLYLAAPVGLTLNAPNPELEREFPFGDEYFYTGVSWNVSALVGLTYWFGSEVGLFVEEGLYYQQVVFPSERRIGGDIEESVWTAEFPQFAVMAGLQIAL